MFATQYVIALTSQLRTDPLSRLRVTECVRTGRDGHCVESGSRFALVAFTAQRLVVWRCLHTTSQAAPTAFVVVDVLCPVIETLGNQMVRFRYFICVVLSSPAGRRCYTYRASTLVSRWSRLSPPSRTEVTPDRYVSYTSA